MADTTNVRKAVGTRLFCCLTESGTFTEVGEITDLGEYGKTYDIIKFQALATGKTFKFTGAYDEGQLAMELGQDLEDAGQAMLLANLGSSIYFQIQFDDAAAASGSTGTIDDFLGTIVSFKTKVGGPNGIIGASCTIEISGDVTRTPASS